jgi:hypothetical protein
VDYNLQHQRISVTWEDDPSTYRVPDKQIYDVAVLLINTQYERSIQCECLLNQGIICTLQQWTFLLQLVAISRLLYSSKYSTSDWVWVPSGSCGCHTRPGWQ